MRIKLAIVLTCLCGEMVFYPPTLCAPGADHSTPLIDGRGRLLYSLAGCCYGVRLCSACCMSCCVCGSVLAICPSEIVSAIFHSELPGFGWSLGAIPAVCFCSIVASLAFPAAVGVPCSAWFLSVFGQLSRSSLW
ncbi:hypothetical protein ILYODFUR_035842 [Ilyodon furcidens]|uniref:Secreted protein n=1 Tax=Ilyodon furcidens TaxID=33524 RepID=A0ABV0UD48_9TELE